MSTPRSWRRLRVSPRRRCGGDIMNIGYSGNPNRGYDASELAKSIGGLHGRSRWPAGGAGRRGKPRARHAGVLSGTASAALHRGGLRTATHRSMAGSSRAAGATPSTRWKRMCGNRISPWVSLRLPASEAQRIANRPGIRRSDRHHQLCSCAALGASACVCGRYRHDHVTGKGRVFRPDDIIKVRALPGV